MTPLKKVTKIMCDIYREIAEIINRSGKLQFLCLNVCNDAFPPVLLEGVIFSVGSVVSSSSSLALGTQFEFLSK